MMTVQVPDELELALKDTANAQGLSPSAYISTLLKRELAPNLEQQAPPAPFKTGRGSLTKFGHAPSPEDIEANRRDIFRAFGDAA